MTPLEQLIAELGDRLAGFEAHVAEAIAAITGRLIELENALPEDQLQSNPFAIGAAGTVTSSQSIAGTLTVSEAATFESTIKATGAVTTAAGLGVFGHAAPAGQHAAIASPAAELAPLKAAVDLIREVLKEYGFTA